MLRALDEEHLLSEIFTAFLLARGMRLHADLVDQLFDSSKTRLAGVLWLMSGIGESGAMEAPPLEILEEGPAEVIDEPKSEVRYLLNGFCEHGFIRHDGQIHVHRSLLDAILHGRLPGDNTATPEIVPPAR